MLGWLQKALFARDGPDSILRQTFREERGKKNRGCTSTGSTQASINRIRARGSATTWLIGESIPDTWNSDSYRLAIRTSSLWDGYRSRHDYYWPIGLEWGSTILWKYRTFTIGLSEYDFWSHSHHTNHTCLRQRLSPSISVVGDISSISSPFNFHLPTTHFLTSNIRTFRYSLNLT